MKIIEFVFVCVYKEFFSVWVDLQLNFMLVFSMLLYYNL